MFIVKACRIIIYIMFNFMSIVFNQCDDLAHSPGDCGDEHDKIVINRFELVAIGTIILLLATCLSVTLLNRFAREAVVYEYEQLKAISPSAAVRASRAGVEDVPLSQVVSIMYGN